MPVLTWPSLAAIDSLTELTEEDSSASLSESSLARRVSSSETGEDVRLSIEMSPSLTDCASRSSSILFSFIKPR